MGRVGRFILKVAAVLILTVSAGTFALSYLQERQEMGIICKASSII